MPDPTPAVPMDPEFEALVEECERLAELRTDVAVSDRPASTLTGLDDAWDAARAALWAAVLAYGDRRAEEARGEALREVEPDLWWPADDGECSYPDPQEYLHCVEAEPGSIHPVTVAVTLAPRFVAALPEEVEYDGDAWGYYGTEPMVTMTRAEAEAAIEARKAVLRTALSSPAPEGVELTPLYHTLMNDMIE